MTDTFIPVTARRLPEDASTLQILKAAIRNPIEIWSDYFYREHTHTAKILGQTVHTTTDPELVKAVLLTHFDDFPKSDLEQVVLERATGHGLLTAQDNEWRFQRRATSPIFRHRNLLGLAPTMVAAGREAGETLAQTESVQDVLPIMANATLKVIGSTLLSGEEDGMDFDEVSRTVDTLIENLGKVDVLDFFTSTRRLPRPWGKDGRAALKWMQDAASDVIIGRHLSDKNAADLLGLLMSAVDPDTDRRLSDTQIRDNVITFIGAGHETTSLALSWSLYLLAHHPDWQDRLVAERRAVCGDRSMQPKDIDVLTEHEMVVNEAMRLYPPAPSLDRSAARDITIGDLKIAKGDVVVLAIYAMHRHKKLWDMAERFDPTRFAPDQIKARHRFQYIPFSGGGRICIGWKFAVMEAMAILSEVLAHVRVAPDPDFAPYPRARITLRPVGGMKLQITPRG